MRLGLLDMIGLAATLAFALPVGSFGVTQILAGEQTLGAAMVVVAVAMVVLPQFFFDPGRILRNLLKGLLPKGLRDRLGDESAEAAGETVEK